MSIQNMAPDNLEPNFVKSLSGSGDFFNFMIELVWPFQKGVNGWTNGWWSNSTWKEKLNLLLFSNPTALVRLVGIVFMILVIIISAFANWGNTNVGSTMEAIFWLSLIFFAASFGYFFVSAFMFKSKYKYDYTFFTKYSNNMNGNMNTTVNSTMNSNMNSNMNDYSNGSKQVDTMNIETSIISNGIE